MAQGSFCVFCARMFAFCPELPLSQNHRMAQVGRNLKDHPVPTPCCEQGHLELEQVA